MHPNINIKEYKNNTELSVYRQVLGSKHNKFTSL